MRVERRAPLWRALAAFAVCAVLSAAAPDARAAIDSETVDTFITRLWPEAKSRGVSRETFERAFDDFKPDPSLGQLNAKQPEFERPLGAYVAERVTATRIEAGRRKAQEHASCCNRSKAASVSTARSCSRSGAWNRPTARARAIARLCDRSPRLR